MALEPRRVAPLQPDADRGAPGPAMRHSVMLEVNEYLVLDLVRSVSQTTRPEIGARLGLSAASVSRIVRRLVARGLVVERPGVSAGGGRPRSTIVFNERAGSVIGVDLGGTRCHAVLADLSGGVIDQDVRSVSHDGQPFDTLVAAIGAMRRCAVARGLPLAALAVGIPAVLEPATGLAVGGPSVGWDGFPVVARLSAVIDVPFVVENDANLAALAHAWRGDGRTSSEFALLAIGTGIGAGIISGGRLLRGHRSAAGEAGYLVLDRRLLRTLAPGGRGALERIASGPAIAATARERMTGGAGTRPCGIPGPAPEMTAADVFQAARDGDPVARGILDMLVEDVAMAIVAVAAITDPELVILDGAVGRALAPWHPLVVELVEAALPVPPAVVISSMGSDATAVGAVAAALELAASRRAPDAFFDAVAVHVGHGGLGGARVRAGARAGG